MHYYHHVNKSVRHIYYGFHAASHATGERIERITELLACSHPQRNKIAHHSTFRIL
jgi:hypothetical protein